MKQLFIILFLVSNACMSNAQQSVIGIGDGVVDNNYIGGYMYHNIKSYNVFKGGVNRNNATYFVKNKTEFLHALNVVKRGEIIYVADDAKIDLTGQHNLIVPGEVSIVSGRGLNKKKGGLILTSNLDTNPLFVTGGNSVKFIGLRIQGPDGNVIDREKINALLARRKANGIKEKIPVKKLHTYALPNSQGIKIDHKGVIIENCEIYNWSYAAIAIMADAQAKISHSYIHHNQRFGLGYGILVEGDGHVIANIFDFNRHAIASSGAPGARYIAEYNIALQNSSDQGHIFDVHGGKDRNDGTNVAGDVFIVRNNLFYYKNQPVVKIRGVSKSVSKVYNNSIIINTSKSKNNLNDSNSSIFVLQNNSKGNLEVYGNKVITD